MTWTFVEYGDDGSRAVAELTEEQAAAVKSLLSSDLRLHVECHDLVCNGSRSQPRGAKGSGCSCRTRERMYANSDDQVSLAAASLFIRKVIDALGKAQPPLDAVVNLKELSLEVVGQIEELKSAVDRSKT